MRSERWVGMLVLVLIGLAICGKSPVDVRKEADRVLRSGDKSKALDLYEEAISLGDPFQSHFKRALIYEMMGQFNRAIQDLKKVIRVKPDFTVAYLSFLKLSIQVGEYEGVVFDGDKVEEEYKEEYEGYVAQYKHCKASMEQYERATTIPCDSALLNEVLACAPHAYNPLLRRIECEVEEKAYEKVIHNAHQLTRNHPLDVKGHSWKGVAYMAMGNVEGAELAYKAALTANDEDKGVRKWYKGIRRYKRAIEEMESHIEGQRYKESLPAIEAAKKALPSLPGAIVERLNRQACFSSMKAKEEGAIRACTIALEGEGEDWEIYMWRAEAHLDQDNYEAAEKDLDMAARDERSREQGRRIQELRQQAAHVKKMALRKDYYKILGVGKKATAREIKRAYKQKVKLVHPDKHQGDESKLQAYYDLTEAKTVLGDPEKRAKYDRGEDMNGPQQAGNPFQGFNPFAGGQFHFRF